MSPEESMHARVIEERARRTAIHATVDRKVDDRVRMLDPAFRDRSHAEHVRDLVVSLGEIGALDPSADEPDFAPAWSSIEALQDTLVDLAADVQAWMESNLRDAAR